MAQASAMTGSTSSGAASDQKFSMTFHIETLRMIAYSTLVFMVGVGIVVTNTFVPHELKDIQNTTIFKIFGFNHICNVFDHMPSREISLSNSRPQGGNPPVESVPMA